MLFPLRTSPSCPTVIQIHFIHSLHSFIHANARVSHFYDFTPLFTVISSVPGWPKPQILLIEVILGGTQPCLTRTTTRSSPLLWQVVDASAEGTCMCMVFIGVRTNDVTEVPQTPEHDCLGDRRLSRVEADFLVGDMSCKWDSYNVSKAPLIERVESLAGPHRHVPHFWGIQ